MNRDPTVVGRAQVGAETFAGVVNSFVDPISWKTMVRSPVPFPSSPYTPKKDKANLTACMGGLRVSRW